MHRIYIWFSFSYLTLIYIFSTYTIHRTAEFKKKLFGHAPSVFRRASKSLLNLVIYIKKKTTRQMAYGEPDSLEQN